jgi:hypothetical protein
MRYMKLQRKLYFCTICACNVRGLEVGFRESWVWRQYSPHVSLLVAELSIRVPLHPLQELPLHLRCRRRCCSGRIALRVPVSHLLPIRVRVLCSCQRLSNRCSKAGNRMLSYAFIVRGAYNGENPVRCPSVRISTKILSFLKRFSIRNLEQNLWQEFNLHSYKFNITLLCIEL